MTKNIEATSFSFDDSVLHLTAVPVMLLLARPQPFHFEMAQSVACEAQSSCQKPSRLPAAVVPCTQGSGNLSREAGVLVEEWAPACDIGQDSQRRLEKEMSPSQLNALSKAKHALN